MDEKQLHARITQAVDSHCAHLTPDPDLARRILRTADRKEPILVKKKMSLGLILALILILLTGTAVAVALLTGMELVEQSAVPMAQGNDEAVRPVEDYTFDELQSIILEAQENGIFLDDDSSIMRALRRGEGYSEEETIMEICRVAFGGLYYEWTLEERYWFHEKMIDIGFSTSNGIVLPGEGELSSAEARALADQTIRENYGADLPLDDPAHYSRTEEFAPADQYTACYWRFEYIPRTLDGAAYFVNIHGLAEEITHGQLPGDDWTTYTEQDLINRINNIYNYRYAGTGMVSWECNAWHAFGQKLPGAQKSPDWSSEHDGYLATVYLLPGENDMTKQQAREIAFRDAGVNDYTSVTELLLGRGETRIWKISFITTENSTHPQVLSYEIDSLSREILRKDSLTDEKTWARYMLSDTYHSVRPEDAGLSRDAALGKAVAALHSKLNDASIPYTDEDCYTINAHRNERTGAYQILFDPKVMDYGRASVEVASTGEVRIIFANAPGVDGDNLFSRFCDVYDSDYYWDQAMWVKFGEEMKKYEPATFEGRLFKQTTYLPESAVTVSRDKAMDIAYLDSGKADINRIVLIGAQPHPVWKVRASTWPVTTLYEIDAMTGEILDREYYFIQEPNFDHEMKMYTLRSVYMPAALAEFGVERIAMELCTKAHVDAFVEYPADYLMSGAYRVSAEGMTVSFLSLDPHRDSYIVTVAQDGMSAQIDLIPAEEGIDLISDEDADALYAAYARGGHFREIVVPEDFWLYDPENTGDIQGAMTLEEAQAHAFRLLLKAVGRERVEAFPDLAVSYHFDTITRHEGDAEQPRWHFHFVNPDNPQEGWKVTFAIWDGVPDEVGDVKPVADTSNG